MGAEGERGGEKEKKKEKGDHGGCIAMNTKGTSSPSRLFTLLLLTNGSLR